VTMLAPIAAIVAAVPLVGPAVAVTVAVPLAPIGHTITVAVTVAITIILGRSRHGRGHTGHRDQGGKAASQGLVHRSSPRSYCELAR